MEKFPSNPEVDPEKMEKARIAYKALDELLNNWSNTIPDEIVHEGKSKIRGNWWNPVLGFLQAVVSKGLISDPDLSHDIRNLALLHTGRQVGEKEIVRTKADIDSADALILRTLKHLEAQFPGIELSS
jgi:hypothetical protein